MEVRAQFKKLRPLISINGLLMRYLNNPLNDKTLNQSLTMKVPFILLIILVTFSVDVLSQDYFSMYFEAGSNYTNRKFDYPDKIITNDVEPRYTFSASMKAGYQLYKGLQIISGLQYFNRSLTVIIDYQEKTNISFHYFELPILAKYVIGMGKIEISPIVGFTNGLLFAMSYSNELRGWEDVGFIWELGEYYNRYDLSFYGGIEFSYWINYLAFKIEPKFNHSLLTRIDHTGVNEYFYSYGINFGIIYRFPNHKETIEPE